MNSNILFSFEMEDNQTIISDITDLDNNTVSSTDLTQKMNELTSILENRLNELTNDVLKEKCKELNVSGSSKMKKHELIKSLIDEFNKLCLSLQDKKIYELKTICKTYNIKSNTKKNDIIINILQHCSTNMLFKLDIDGITLKQTEKEKAEIKLEKVESKSESKTEKTKRKDKEVEKCSNDNSSTNNSLNVLENLEKQKLEIEMRMKEVLEKELEEKRKVEEAEKRLKEAEDKRIAHEEAEKKRMEEQQKKLDKEELKKKKQSIPKQVRTIVWNHYIGEDIIKHKCLCCKKVTITNTNFDVGHVLSEKNGGTHEINNLRPICGSCNHSMGIENMIDFVVKYGLYIG
jgi:5-methylcytosine-specific restriction endonuclease McrA